MRTFLTIPVFLISLTSLYAQAGAGLPVQFIQFFRTYNLVNPAGLGRDTSIGINTGNLSLLGAFSGVRTFYASANTQIGNTSSKGTHHVMGAYFINDKEGTYINKNRVSLLYAIQIPLGERLYLNAGTAAGFINYSYKATDVNAGGSAIAPNADIGLWLQKKDFNLGISINQIIPAKLTPIEETYTINKYFNLFADKTFLVDNSFSIKPAFVFRYLNKEVYNVDLALLTLIQNNILAGITYKYQRGFALCAVIDNLTLKKEIFRFTFSYYYPASKFTYYNSQSIEISLGFMLLKQPKVEYIEE